MPPLSFAYYCSGHGYGHATRVSAFTRHLLALQDERPTVYIVSSAPRHVFADSIACGALYRYAEIDPVIVQPLAYRVDRQKSVDVLKSFLSKKDILLERERQWLLKINVHAVLSDAAFLGCLAANAAGIPSILITNFTFDSVYSYLATPILDLPSPAHNHDYLDAEAASADFTSLVPDVPVPLSELVPLVEQIHSGYRCADLLLLLPGCIPIPSFSVSPALPSSDWVDVATKRVFPQITKFLTCIQGTHTLHPIVPFPRSSTRTKPKHVCRQIKPAPLLVRPPSAKASVYTPAGRAKLLESIGVPSEYHDHDKTKILVVSFGGQVFKRPGSRSRSNRSSRSHTPSPEPGKVKGSPLLRANELGADLSPKDVLHHLEPAPPSPTGSDIQPLAPARIATPSHLWIPGAPPASKPPSSSSLVTSTSNIPAVNTVPPSPAPLSEVEADSEYFSREDEEEDSACLLPDESWIAIVCGVSKEQWLQQSDEELPEKFYVAPRDVYMPDLTAIGDVLLGKLGYGTVSECVDACTPFVYVSRPLFIEEHGLRLLLDRDGVGSELSRHWYEAGHWASKVQEAYERGRDMKTRKRCDMGSGIGSSTREQEGRQMAVGVVEWVREWWDGPGCTVGEGETR
ncbi:hypothetical protein BDQ12DRAFT_602020 [Crucibulum laeve]|uniref:Uncharacterized protein n=1 Tax=Crucibulum laeve TaxID=68775 RepID=A0A5C3MGD0_9AGAR|nr:hypothetical protein BDQ12DRAFT_602020 [Crucibulum laeve]